MKRYRPRAVLMLLLVLHMTACYTWQGIATTGPGGVIEATQPDRVRAVVQEEGPVELWNPSVEGDQLVGANGISLSLEDVLMIQTREFNVLRTLLAAWGAGTAFVSILFVIGYAAGGGPAGY